MKVAEKKEEQGAEKKPRKWSGKVTKESNGLDLEEGIFKSDDPKKIAASLKKSAEASHRRKGSSFQSAMSMLNFYENRAGKNLSKAEKNHWRKLRTSSAGCTARKKNEAPV